MGERRHEGRSIVAGCAGGRFVAIDRELDEIYRLAIEPSDVPAQIERLHRAIGLARQEIERTRLAVPDPVCDDLAPIFDAQKLLLDDSALQRQIIGRIEAEKVNAEWAVRETFGELAKRFADFEAAHLRERAQDLRDVARALLRALGDDQETGRPDLERFGEPIVLFGHDLTPSDAIRLARAGVAAFALEIGGEASHTAIIARALNLPLVSGLAGLTDHDLEAERAIVDGDLGLLILDPEAATEAHYRRHAAESERREHELEGEAAAEARTLDGESVRLMANIDLPQELGDVRRYGSEGVGLYRSEFLFIEKSPELPTEEEQLAVLHELIDASAPHPAVVRTFDLGGRKLAKEVIETREENPVLGLRGIRLTLQRSEIFKSQLRAILRAGAHGRLRVLLPMVTGVAEIRQFREIAHEAAEELRAEGADFREDFRLGAMIEVPSAAMMADRIASEVDFLSLGTNDLVQYALAVDRNNEQVAYLYQPLHPAILRMVRFVVDSARKAGIEVVACGEVAADPRITPLLLGLGLRRLSVTPRAIPRIKKRVREVSAEELAAVADRCLDADSPEDVQEALRQSGNRGLSHHPQPPSTHPDSGDLQHAKARRDHRQAVGIRVDPRSHRSLRRQDPARGRRARAVAAVPREEGRDPLPLSRRVRAGRRGGR